MLRCYYINDMASFFILYFFQGFSEEPPILTGSEYSSRANRTLHSNPVHVWAGWGVGKGITGQET